MYLYKQTQIELVFTNTIIEENNHSCKVFNVLEKKKHNNM